jgi:hypothetical protein
MSTIVNVLLAAIFVIVVDFLTYAARRLRRNPPAVRSLRIAAVTTAIITGVIGVAVFFYLNAA